MDSLMNLLEDAIIKLKTDQCKVADLMVVLDKIKSIFGEDEDGDEDAEN